MRFIALIAVALGVCAPLSAVAAISGFNFSGEIANISPQSIDPFHAGFTVDPQTLVSGRVLYDTNSVPLPPDAGCDCLIYPQHIAGGYSAMFGDVPVHADEYFVHVKNDRPGTGGIFQDIISIFNMAFSTDPALTKPIWVDGIEYPNSRFYLNLYGAGDTFSDPSLPASLNLNQYNSLFNFLDEITTNVTVDVLFSSAALTSLQVHPGDYNISGFVEAGDYDIWSRTFGESAGLVADGNGDGVVNAADYVVWRKYDSSSSFGAAVVPEPGTLFLALLGLLVALPRRSRLRRCLKTWVPLASPVLGS